MPNAEQIEVVEFAEQLPEVQQMLREGWTMERVAMPDGEIQIRLSAGPLAVFPSVSEVSSMNGVTRRANDVRVA